MEKIDRLGWAAGISFAAYGLRAGVRVSNPAVLNQVVERLPPGSRPLKSPTVDLLYSLVLGGEGPRPGTRRYSLLYGGPMRLARTMKLEDLFEAFESDLHLTVAEWAPRHVFVHAGVVGWRGRAILIPGRSLSGKSTLVAALVRAGATYYSDEYAVLDQRGLVHPFPRPLSQRNEGGLTRTRLSAEALGGKVGIKPLPVGLVVLTQYKEGRRWRARRLSPGEGVLGLLANTVSARRAPNLALQALRPVAANAEIYRGIRGGADETAQLLLRKIRRSRAKGV